MKKNIIISSVSFGILGLLITLGPQFLFKACNVHNDTGVPPHCFYSIQAEIGVGIIITVLSICLIIFSDIKIQQGLIIGLFFISIIALFIPNWLIGGCEIKTMRCHRIAFPFLNVITSFVLAGTVLYMFFISRKIKT